MSGTGRKCFSAAAVGWLAILILPGLATAQPQSNESVPAARVLIAAGDHDYPPYQFVQDNRATGFHVEVLRAVAEEQGLTVDFRLLPWNQAVRQFEAGEIDILCGVSSSPNRRETMMFSVPYDVVSYGIFTPRESTVRTLEDLAGRPVLVQQGDVMQETVARDLPTARLTAVENSVDMINLLAEPEPPFAAALLPRLQGLHFLEAMGLREQVRLLPQVFYPRPFSFAVRQDDALLLARLNEGLKMIETSGRLDDLRNQWFGVYLRDEPGWRRLVRALVLSLALATAVALGMFLWSVTLRKRVAVRARELNRELGERRAAEERERHLNQVLLAIRNVNQLIVREDDERKLLERAVVNLVETLGYFNVWIMLTDKDGGCRELAQAGFADRQFEDVPEKLANGWRPRCLERLRAGEQLFVAERTAEQCPECLLSGGNREMAGLAAALRHEGRDYGYLVASVPAKFAHDGMEQDLFIELVDDLAFALHKIGMVEALHRSEEKYRQLAEGGDAILWEYDIASDRWTYVAPQVGRILGYEPAEWTNLQFWIDRLHEDDRHWASAYCAECTARGEAHEFEYRFRRKDDDYVWLRDVVQVDMKDGRPCRMRGLMLDITESRRVKEARRKLENQLRQSQKMEAIGRLAGGVAHDFNNMLQTILGYTEMSLLEVEAGSALQESFQEIEKAALHSADLTRQLLAFARKQTISPRLLHLNDEISGMLKMLRRLLGEDLNLLWKPGGELWPVRMDPALLQQALVNLAVNARDAAEAGGRLTIETENVEIDQAYCRRHGDAVPGEYAMIAVADDGQGMDSEVLEQIFEPFFTTKQAGRGTGLGLATVYGIVRQSEGFVNVYSEVGRGTVFQIHLPRSRSSAAEQPEEKIPKTAPRGSETILLVEDNQALLDLARKMLERLGYQVLAAASPKQALRLMEHYAGQARLLVTDVVMPEMSGRELWQKLLERGESQLKCLYMSGYTANVIAHHGILDHGVNFIGKPFSTYALAVKVREVLDGK